MEAYKCDLCGRLMEHTEDIYLETKGGTRTFFVLNKGYVRPKPTDLCTHCADSPKTTIDCLWRR